VRRDDGAMRGSNDSRRLETIEFTFNFYFGRYGWYGFWDIIMDMIVSR
jgi:hypothetical protein